MEISYVVIENTCHLEKKVGIVIVISKMELMMVSNYLTCEKTNNTTDNQINNKCNQGRN